MFQADPASLAPSPAAAGAADPRALIERHLAVLTRLTDIGMAIAEAAGREATAAPVAPDESAFRGDPGLAYTRAARAVRMTIALQVQLLKDLAAFDKAEGEAAKARADRRRVGVQRLIEDALAETERFDGRSVHRLSMEARERLFDADIDAEVQGLSFAEIVARICGDLGLPPEQAAQIVAAAEGSPLISHRVEDGGSTAEGREGGGCAITAGRPAPAAPSTAFRGPPPPLHGGGSDTFLEWPPPA